MFVDAGKLFLPSQLALNYGNITHAGPVSDVAEAVQNVHELDLSNTGFYPGTFWGGNFPPKPRNFPPRIFGQL